MLNQRFPMVISLKVCSQHLMTIVQVLRRLKSLKQLSKRQAQKLSWISNYTTLIKMRKCWTFKTCTGSTNMIHLYQWDLGPKQKIRKLLSKIWETLTILRILRAKKKFQLFLRASMSVSDIKIRMSIPIIKWDFLGLFLMN